MKKLLMTGIAGVCLAVSSTEAMGDVQIHGFVSQGFIHSGEYNYLTPDSKDGSYEFAEYGLNVSKQLNDRLRVGMQLFARDLGDQGNNEITIDWAYADYRIGDSTGLRIGKLHTPIGLYNEGRDVDLLRTTILMPQSVYDESLRDVYSFRGALLYSNFELSDEASVDVKLFTGAPQLSNDTPFVQDSFFGAATAVLGSAAAARNAILSGNNGGEINDYWGYQAIFNTGIEGLRLGISDAFGEIRFHSSVNPAFSSALDMKHYRVISAEYTRDRFSIRHERMDGEFATIPGGVNSESEANYTQITYDTQDKWQFSVYKDTQYPNALVKNKAAINSYQEDTAFSIRYDVDDNFILKAEWHDMEGTAGIRPIHNIGAAAVKDWDVFLLKATFFF